MPRYRREYRAMRL